MLCKIVVLGLLCCLASAQSNYDKLKDAYWSTVTEQSDSHCRIDVQFYYRNYLALNTGVNCATPGLFAGTFALSATDTYIQYASVPSRVAGLVFMKFAYAFSNNDNTLTLTTAGLVPVVLQKQPADPLRDGVWDGTPLNAPGITLRSFFLGDTYISWTLNPSSTDGYFGRAPRVGNDGTIIFGAISTSQTAPWNISQVYPTTYGFGPAPYFNVTINGNNGGQFTNRRAADTLFDGSWAGLNNGCYETIEFNHGLFRDYKVACTDRAAIMGVYDRNSTHLTVRYGYSDVAGLKDQIWILPFQMSTDGLNLTIQTPGGGVIKYFKAAASNARRVTVTLSTDYNSWTPAKLQGVLQGLASFLGIPVANIEVVATSSGSVVLDTVVFDDVITGRSAASAVSQLTSLRSIAGYDVRVVDPLNPNPSAGSALFPSFILSAVAILVALFVRA